MADNFLYIPELNPVIFYETPRSNLPIYFTKAMGDFPFAERLYFWQQRDDYKQVWQTTDTIRLQFESTFDPIIVSLLDEYGNEVAVSPAVFKMPNKYLPGTFAYEVEISLATVPTGCYRVQIAAGTKTYISHLQYISDTPLENTLLVEYRHSRFHKDVIFETGITFQIRLLGVFGFLEKSRKDEAYRDERFNPVLLNSRSAKQWPVYFGIPADGFLSSGDFIGLPDDIINIIDEIWSCDTVLIDGKSYGLADGSKPEYTTPDGSGLYAKRGVKVTVEAGINRSSKIFAVATDTTKKIMSSIFVESKVFGDTANAGAASTIPVKNIE